MRIITTRLHGLIDYGWGILLLSSPVLFGFVAVPAAAWTAWLFGAGAILYSLVTDYERGLFRIVPVPVHLGLDALAGGLLALSPLVLGLRGPAAWLFGLFGLASLAAAFLTETAPRRA